MDKHHKRKYKIGFWPWFICGLGALFYCYEYFLRITPSVIDIDLMRAYQIDAAMFGSLAAYYYHAYTPMQLVVGVMMDRYGPRRLLVFACLCCVVGTYLFANSHALWIAEFGRFMVGFGSAFAFVGVLKLATIWLPPDRFAFVSGLTTALGMLGAMFGDITLTELVKFEGWRNTMIISAAVGLVLAAIMALIIRDINVEAQHRYHDASEYQTFRYLILGLIKLIKNPQIWLIGIIGCLGYTSASAFGELWAIHYLKENFQFNSSLAASASSLIFLGWTIGGPLTGWVSDKIHRRAIPLAIGSFITAVLFTILLYVPQLSQPIIFALFFGIGLFSGVQVIVFAMACENASIQLSGTAIALTNMMVMVGGSITEPLIGLLLDKHWNGQVLNNVRVYSTSDYQVALSMLPISYFIVFLICFLIRRPAKLATIS